MTTRTQKNKENCVRNCICILLLLATVCHPKVESLEHRFALNNIDTDHNRNNHGHIKGRRNSFNIHILKL